MVQQVRSGNIESQVTLAETLIGNSCCQVCLATAAGTAQDEPSSRFSGKCPGCLVSATKLFLVDGIPASALGE
ncbi:hypothetical protein ES703_49549 [subsurface metagenome]